LLLAGNVTAAQCKYSYLPHNVFVIKHNLPDPCQMLALLNNFMSLREWGKIDHFESDKKQPAIPHSITFSIAQAIENVMECGIAEKTLILNSF